MSRLLPQANTLATVIRTFVYASSKINCTLQDISRFCHFAERQASYYANACQYLGLLDENLQPTTIGKKILEDVNNITINVYMLVINDSLIGPIFHYMLLYPAKEARTRSIAWVRSQYPEYGDPVIIRRTSSLASWCQEIIDYIKR